MDAAAKNKLLSAFTLFELIIVLTIISAMALVVVPYTTNSNDHLKLKQNSLDIAETIKYAIDLATNTQKVTRFILNTKHRTYHLEIASQPGTFEPINTFSGLHRTISDNIYIYDLDGFAIDQFGYYLQFDPATEWPNAEVTLATVKALQKITLRACDIQIEESSI